MENQSTIDRLREMRLSVAAAAYQDQDSMRGVEGMSFDERLAQIVDAEWDSRRSNKRVRLMRQAQLSCPDANVADIIYDSDRGIDSSEMLELSNCTWVTDRRNVVLVGASGAGKTWIGCALAVAACNAFHTVRYVRMPEMLDELAASRDEDWLRAKKRYRKCDLLFMDDWLLEPVGPREARELLELVESCYRNGSLIICSQYGPSGWHERISEGALADAVIDRKCEASHLRSMSAVASTGSCTIWLLQDNLDIVPCQWTPFREEVDNVPRKSDTVSKKRSPMMKRIPLPRAGSTDTESTRGLSYVEAWFQVPQYRCKR